MTSGITCIFFVLSLNALAHSYQAGAPSYICKSMFPTHEGFNAQVVPSPYVISTSSTDKDDGVVKIKLHSKSTSEFVTGFLLKVKNTTPFSSTNANVTSGVFISDRDDSAVFRCDGDKTSAATHSNSNKKQSVEIKWQAPPGYNGEVVFIATFVHNFTTFWTGVESSPIHVTRKAALVETENETDMHLNTTLLKMYNGCGVTKNCLSSPDDCISTKTCKGLLTILPTFDSYQIEMFATKSKFVAVGFSDDKMMGGDSNVECAYEDPAVKAYRSWNIPRKFTNVRLQDSTGVTLARGVYENNVVYCKLKVEAVMTVPGLNRTFDLNKNRYYVALVSGRELSESKAGVGYHDIMGVMSKGRYLLPVISDPADEFFYDTCSSADIVCYGLPEGCLPYKNCRFVTKISVQDNLYIVSMLAKRAAYIATAFTEDRRRGNDHIVECVNNGSSIQTYRSWNVPYSFDNYRMGTTGVELFNGTETSDGLICTVMFDPSVIPSFKLDQPYYLILVAGSSLRPQQVGYHNLAKSFNNESVSLYKNGTRKNVFYTGCGENRRCFGIPEGCTSKKSCDVAVSTAPDNVGNRYSIHMMSTGSPGYIAVGLSEDKVLGNDIVIECVREEKVVKTYMSWNFQGEQTSLRIKPNPMTHLHGSFINGKLECIVMFQTPKFTFQNKTFDLTKDDYVLMLATGKSTSPPSNNSEGGLLELKFSAVSGAQPLHLVHIIEPPSKILIYLHGTMMIFSWIGMTSIGLILAQYYKNPNEKDMSFLGILVRWHSCSMSAVSILTIIGVGVIYIHCDGILKISSSYHALLGFITAVLALIQPIFAVTSPHSATTHRILVRRLQWFIENMLHVVAVITTFLAVNLEELNLPKWTNLILAIFVIYYIIVHLILMVVRDIKTKTNKKGSENGNVKMENGNQLLKEFTKLSLTEKCFIFEKKVFTFHVGIVAVFVMLLMYLCNRFL